MRYAGLLSAALALEFLLVTPLHATADENAAAQEKPSSATAKSPDDVFYLRWLDPGAERDSNSPCGVLWSELYRQAFLLTAREEFRLVARDERLGDSSSKTPRTFAIGFHMTSNQRLMVDVVQSLGKLRRTAAELETIEFDREQPNWVAAIESAEALSREQFADVLHKAKFSRRANPVRESGPIPPGIDKQLAPLGLSGHIVAARKLHVLMHEPGESPEVLGALVRVYANLGLLTEHLWQPLHKSYKARALLYAQRLVKRQPDSAWGLWHRAYAAALAGLPKLALADLESAGKLARAGQAPPEWVELIDAYCRCDLDRLEACAAGSDKNALPHLLLFLVSNQPSAYASAIEVGLRAADRAPACLRLLDALNEAGGVRLRHQTTTAPFAALLNDLPLQIVAMPDAPKATVELARDLLRRSDPNGDEESTPPWEDYARLIESLTSREAAAADRGEPSCGAFGALLLEGAFSAAWRRAVFLREALAVDADDFLQEIQPLVAAHPFQGLLALHASDRRKQDAGVASAINRVEFEYSERVRGELMRFKDVRLLRDALQRVLYMKEYFWLDRQVAGDARYEWSMDTSPACAQRYRDTHPHSPEPIIRLIRSKDPRARESWVEWEKQFARHPGVQAALATQYFKEEQFADAQRCLRALLDRSKDWWAYEKLAAIQKQQGDLAGWQATLEESLGQPDYGLYHARARVELADHFLQQGDVQKAIPYAEAAAETGACWAMQCASRVHEQAGNLDESEEWISRCTTRYRGQEMEWLNWCVRNGQGDFKEALDAAGPAIELAISKNDPRDLRILAFCHIAAHKPRKARELFQQAESQDQDATFGLHVAVLSEELQDPPARDAALKALRERADKEKKREAIELATWLETVYASGGLTEKAFENAPEEIKAIRGGSNPDVQYYLGRLLIMAGLRNEGIECLKASGKHPGGFWSGRLSRTLLEELGVEIENPEKALRARPAAAATNDKSDA